MARQPNHSTVLETSSTQYIGQVYFLPSIASPCAAVLAPRDFSFRIIVRASPSTHTSLKPISFANETALKHALASAVVGSGMFFHKYVHEAITKPSLFRAVTFEYDVLGSV
ncbi:hypothetical protein PVK06_039118 [Gossypium arboreum]|uniref:Uncharacterized protein n=1 Tax=Gossypium arboreum TaxID=29729 RepID=A0ABR0N2M6_GOSAR|nr:hypothetical protein PVK06_039118 [Gossypium arboreum]